MNKETNKNTSFRYLALVELAEVLGKQQDAKWEKVEFLLDMCPEISQLESFKPNQENELDQIDPGFLLADEAQDACLATAKYLIFSGGTYSDKLLPTLLEILKKLPHFVWQESSTMSPENFTYNFISSMRQISEIDVPIEQKSTAKSLQKMLTKNMSLRKMHSEKTTISNSKRNDLIAEGLVLCLQECSSILIKFEDDAKFFNEGNKRFPRILFGLFKALSEGLPNLEMKQVDILVRLIIGFLETQSKQKTKSRIIKSLMVLSVNILTRITCLPLNLEDLPTKCLKIARGNMTLDFLTNSEGTKSNSQIDLFISSVELFSTCALQQPELTKESFSILANLLKQVSEIENINENLCESVIKAIRNISVNDNNFIEGGLDVLVEFLSTKNSHDIAFSSICELIAFDLEFHNGPYVTTQFINSTSNKLYNLKEDSDFATVLVEMLTKVAVEINNSNVSSLIYQVVSNQFSKAKRDKNFKDIEKMTILMAKLSAVSHHEQFNDIVENVLSIYQGILDIESTTLASNISEFILRASKDNSKDRMLHLLLKVLGLFNSLGESIQAKNQSSKNKTPEKNLTAHLGTLLSPIGRILEKSGLSIEEPNYVLQKTFRVMWFYCIVYGFVDQNSSLLPDQKEAMTVIAKFAPSLKGKITTDFSKAIQQYDALTSDFNVNALNSLFNALTDILPGNRSAVQKLTISNALFLLSVYHLEASRAVSLKSLENVFPYLEDQGLLINQDMYNFVSSITDVIFEKWMSVVDEESEIIENQTVLLFKCLCSRYAIIRKNSLKYIKKIQEKHRHIYWSFECLKFLLDLHNAIGQGAAIGTTTKLVEIVLPDSDIKLALPEYVSDRESILVVFSELTTEWLKNALNYAPNVAKSGLEEYLFQFRKQFVGSMKHGGYSLALKMSSDEALNSKESFDVLRGISVLNENRSYLLSQSVSIKSYHFGEINSIKEFSGKKGRQLIDLFLKPLYATLENFKSSGRTKLDIKKFNHYLQLATAYLVSEQEINLEILQCIIWIPIYIFTEEAMKSATFCWKWISSARPNSDIKILTELYRAFSWTVDQKLGLFHGTEEYELIELATNIEEKQNEMSNTAPHRLIIEYLSEMYQLVRARGKDIFIKILMRGLKEYPKMNKERHSMGTRFRFCLLGSHVTKNFNDDSTLIQELRTYTYSAALHWFSIHPSWPELDTPEEIVKDDIAVLQEFVRRIKSEKNSAIGSGGSGTRSKNESQSDNVSQNSRKSKISTSKSSFVSNSTNKFMDLLEKLVHNEIERIKLWFNPQKPNQYIHFPPPLETISLKDIPKNSWISYLKEAWKFSPRLALELSYHFRFLNVRKELEELVLNNASSLLDIPEAVEYLVTPENAKKNIKELKYLLNWKPTTLAMALKYLNAPFAENQLVVQYAIRTLRRFSPEEVVFYLAQLVQNLRHDNDGYLRRYMLSMVKQSDMFAHQLMWSLRTEQISKEDIEDEGEKLTPGDFEIRDIADDLILDILNAFSVEQEKLYHEEFDFFDTVTKISGELRLIPKEQQEERRKQLIISAEELKGKITKNLYLPSNVEHKIDSLYPQKSRVLKSAKKVPILLSFQTHKTDSEGKISSKNDVLCIFKMGDDCIFEESIITDSNGVGIKMKELTYDKKVSAFNEHCLGTNKREIIAIINKGEKDCLKLTLLDGKQLICTPDHKILVLDSENKKLIWKEANKIELEEKIISTSQPVINNLSNENDEEIIILSEDCLKSCSKKKYKNRLKFDLPLTSKNVEITSTIFRLMGLVMTDGSLMEIDNEDTLRARVYVGEEGDVKDVLDDISILIENQFNNQKYENFQCKRIDQNGNPYYIYEIPLPSPLPYIMKELGVTIGNRKSQNFSFPIILLNENLPVYILREFASGFMGGDGTVPFLNGGTKNRGEPSKLTQSCEVKFEKSLNSFMLNLKSIFEKLQFKKHIKIIQNYYTKKNNQKMVTFTLTFSKYESELFETNLRFSYAIQKRRKLNLFITFNKIKTKLLERRKKFKEEAINKYNSSDKSQKEIYDELKSTITSYDNMIFPSSATNIFNYKGNGEKIFKFPKIEILNSIMFNFVKSENSTKKRKFSSDYINTELKINDSINFMDFKKPGDLPILEYLSLPLIEVETVGKKPVMDISVLTDTNFVANGCCVHNCRQDCLALQIISMFKRMFQKIKLPLYLYPYRVITTGRGSGVIECVPNTNSRHDVGALTDGSLYDYFLSKYGQPDTVEFQNARRNFIESMAAYTVVSYILNVKDRHNGNILMDEEGHVIHIDFGFLFDTQPGGKFGIEQFVSFKLTKEMLLIMGEGTKEKSKEHSDPFNLFVDLVYRAYLASRDHMEAIFPVVEVMIQSGLPCFKPEVMKNLRHRFSDNLNEQEAVDFMKKKVDSSYENIFSYVYDKFQELFEGVRG